MKKKLHLVPLIVSLIVLGMGIFTFLFNISRAQTGSPHGIVTLWNAPVPVGGSGTIQGYFLFQCVGGVGTCTLTSNNWTSVGGLLAANVLDGANCSGFTNCHLVPASTLTTNTTYSYAVATVDSNGNESAWDFSTPVVVGSSFPSNPNSPVGAASKVQ